MFRHRLTHLPAREAQTQKNVNGVNFRNGVVLMWEIRRGKSLSPKPNLKTIVKWKI